MNETSKMDPFKVRLFNEFDDHAYKVLGVSGDRVREVRHLPHAVTDISLFTTSTIYPLPAFVNNLIVITASSLEMISRCKTN